MCVYVCVSVCIRMCVCLGAVSSAGAQSFSITRVIRNPLISCCIGGCCHSKCFCTTLKDKCVWRSAESETTVTRGPEAVGGSVRWKCQLEPEAVREYLWESETSDPSVSDHKWYLTIFSHGFRESYVIRVLGFKEELSLTRTVQTCRTDHALNASSHTACNFLVHYSVFNYSEHL